MKLVLFVNDAQIDVFVFVQQLSRVSTTLITQHSDQNSCKNFEQHVLASNYCLRTLKLLDHASYFGVIRQVLRFLAVFLEAT